MKEKTVYLKVMVSLAVFIVLMPLTSCKERGTASGPSGRTAADDYIDTREFGEDITLRNLQQAVTTFRLTNGRFPKDIEELSGFTGSIIDPGLYEYDRETGTLSARKAGEPAHGKSTGN